MKKQEDSYRQFLFDYISNEWNNLLLDEGSKLDQSSFIYQLMQISKNGRNYSQDEVNDHIGTMLVAVSFILITFRSFQSPERSGNNLFPFDLIFNYVLTM